ncbi:MAG: uroporphyrinogen decarboxylase family protein [Phycisphaerae bacterium]
MNSLQLTLDFIADKKVSRPPFHPIIMRFAAKYAGVKYRDFCLDYKTKCDAMIKCARDFSLDWVTVMSDPYAEAEAFGLKVDYIEDSLPLQEGFLFNSIHDIDRLAVPEIKSSGRMLSRINEIEYYSKTVGDKYFTVGWVEGPLAEYADLRGLQDACLDLYDFSAKINLAFDIFVENAINFITRQVKAGAHCIGIGDAACSQIGPELYRTFCFKREKILVEHIHSLGALAKLHICGNTSEILPDMIKTGADIIDIDHLVPEIDKYIPLLNGKQVVSGNTDPVAVIQDSDSAVITANVLDCFRKTKGRGIVSAGCEITPGTSIANFSAYSQFAGKLKF